MHEFYLNSRIRGFYFLGVAFGPRCPLQSLKSSAALQFAKDFHFHR